MDGINQFLSTMTSSDSSAEPTVNDSLSQLSTRNTQIDTTINGMVASLNVNNTNASVDTDRARIATLLNTYQDRVREETNAPSNTIEARNAYFNAAYANSASQLTLYYNTEAAPLWLSLTQEKNEILSQLTESISFLQSQTLYLNSLNNGTISPDTPVDTTPPKIDTALRKSSMYQTSDADVMMWTNILNCVIFTYGCILLYHFRNSLLEPLVLLTVTVTFMSVFALDFILKLLFYIPEKIISYIGWGYNPVHYDKWWYLWIPASLIAIYIIISSLL